MTIPNIIDVHAQDWITTRSLLLAKSLNETTKKALRNILAEGFNQGLSIKEITKNIQGYYSESEKWRAEMTSRTEVLTANNQGAVDRYKNEGIEEFEWLASPDSCPECAVLDGQIFSIISGEQPPKHPNCRCSILAVIR